MSAITATTEKPTNAARVRQRLLAAFLPVTAALYIGAEALDPRGTDQVVTSTASWPARARESDMSTMTHTATTRRIVRAEWTKLRTLPSTWRTAVLTLAMAIGFGVAVAFSEAGQWHTMTAQQRQVFDPASVSMVGVMIAAVVLGALAVKTVTSEYSTGMIRSTFIAMPARPLVLAAKAATVAAFAFPVALFCNVAGFELGQRILASKHAQVAIGHPGVVQAMVFGALAVSLTAVIGVGLGGVIRHTAGAATTLALIIIGGLTVGQFLPAGWRQYMPGIATQAAVTVHRSAGLLSPSLALAVLGGYAAIALAAASLRASRSDA
jgi:ABC-2 type transport system permease protein